MKNSRKKYQAAAAGGKRLQTLDLIRGITLVSMILYHGMWDIVNLTDAGQKMPALEEWYTGPGGFIWQQSICWSFILLSGFCVPLSRHIFRRGLQVTGGGLVISAVTLLWMYDERVLFGVLSFLGAAMLLTGGLRKLRSARYEYTSSHTEMPAGAFSKRFYSAAGLAVCTILFYMTRWVNRRVLRLWPGRELGIPSFLYTDGIKGWFLTALGFPMNGFFSTDYFSIVPWIFLFWAGLFLHYVLAAVPAVHSEDPEKQAVNRKKINQNPSGRGCFPHPVFHLEIPFLNEMGKHSLLIYLLHQPVLYLIISLIS